MVYFSREKENKLCPRGCGIAVGEVDILDDKWSVYQSLNGVVADMGVVPVNSSSSVVTRN